jgi:hypothetical protein
MSGFNLVTCHLPDLYFIDSAKYERFLRGLKIALAAADRGVSD